MKSEHLEQVEFVAWFRKTYKGVRIFAIPNGGARSGAQGMALKSEGVVKGVPDLFIPEFRLFIEMKNSKGGQVSIEQKDWIEYLNNCGYIATVCNGFDNAKLFIEKLVNDKNIL